MAIYCNTLFAYRDTPSNFHEGCLSVKLTLTKIILPKKQKGRSQCEAKYMRSMGVTRPEPAVTDGKYFKGGYQIGLHSMHIRTCSVSKHGHNINNLK